MFDGTNPNGEWSLYAMDDSSGDVRSRSASWSLDIETGQTPGADRDGQRQRRRGVDHLEQRDVEPGGDRPGTPATGVTEMRFSNDGVTFSAYQPFAATACVGADGGDGTKTVYAQFRDG